MSVLQMESSPMRNILKMSQVWLISFKPSCEYQLMKSRLVLHQVPLLPSVSLLKTCRKSRFSPCLCSLLCIVYILTENLIHNHLLRYPGVSISGGSQLHHQHQGQELSFVTANALQSAMEPSFCQCWSQRLDLDHSSQSPNSFCFNST